MLMSVQVLVRGLKCFRLRGNTNVKGLTREEETVVNRSESLNLILSKHEKVEYCIRMKKIHKSIDLKFWVRVGVNILCVGLTHVSLVILYRKIQQFLPGMEDFVEKYL